MRRTDECALSQMEPTFQYCRRHAEKVKHHALSLQHIEEVRPSQPAFVSFVVFGKDVLEVLRFESTFIIVGHGVRTMFILDTVLSHFLHIGAEIHHALYILLRYIRKKGSGSQPGTVGYERLKLMMNITKRDRGMLQPHLRQPT